MTVLMRATLVVENEVTKPMKNDFYLQTSALQDSKLSIICLVNLLMVYFLLAPRNLVLHITLFFTNSQLL